MPGNVHSAAMPSAKGALLLWRGHAYNRESKGDTEAKPTHSWRVLSAMSEERGRSFRTLRGFLAGTERDEEEYFASSATLRIFGHIPDLAEITAQMGIDPTNVHRAGERRGERSPPFKQDRWSYTPRVAEERPLADHIDALWAAIRDKKAYLLELKKTLNVDVFLGYRSNCDCGGLEIPHTSLEMFVELQIPLGVSIIIA